MYQNCFENLPNQFAEHDLFPFLIRDGKVYPKKANLLQINTNIISQLEVLPIIITNAIPADRSNDHNFGELPPSQ